MKNNKLIIFLIILISVITIFLSCVFIYALSNYKRIDLIHISFFKQTSNELVVDKEYDLVFNQIKINSQSSDIDFKVNNENKIKLVIYGKKDKIKIVDSNELSIEEKHSNCIGICINRKMPKIQVYLPANYDKLLEINTNYGDVTIASFPNLKANINVDAGDVLIDSIKTANIDNSYGDIKINNYAENLNIKEDCGDIEINQVNVLKAKNNYGNIMINQINNYFDIATDAGDIKIENVNLTKNSNIKNDYGDVKINNTNNIYIDAKTSLGDVKINNNYRYSKIVLNIKNSCGDIKVNN